MEPTRRALPMATLAALLAWGCASSQARKDQPPNRTPAAPPQAQVPPPAAAPPPAQQPPRAAPEPPEPPALVRVHFEYDSALLTPEARELLAGNARILEAHPEVRVRIEGHCDHFGSEAYNLALGDRRARAVRTYLSRLGVPGDRLRVVTFGEERPIVGVGSERITAPDRRSELLVTAGKEAVRSSYPRRGSGRQSGGAGFERF